MDILTSIPARYRKRLYIAYAGLGVVFGAIQVAYASVPGTHQPTWLTVALVVYAYVGTALGLTASANVTGNEGPPPAVQDDGGDL